MKQGSTIFLRAVIIAIAPIVLGICTLALPRLIATELQGDFDYGPIFVGMMLTAIPFFVGVRQALKLLTNIDRNKAFSDSSVTALKLIKNCAYLISASYAAGMPYIFYVGDRDDAPGVVALGFVIVAASFVVATAMAVFQRLVQNAVDIKSENDLTV